MSKEETIRVRQGKQQQALLDHLRRMPIREAAYDKVGVSRMTVSRWRKASKSFVDDMDKAMLEGREFINDLGESQLISLMRQGEIGAIRTWLKANSERYANKLEVKGSIVHGREPLTTEQKKLVRKALNLAALKKTYGKKA